MATSRIYANKATFELLNLPKLTTFHLCVNSSNLALWHFLEKLQKFRIFEFIIKRLRSKVKIYRFLLYILQVWSLVFSTKCRQLALTHIGSTSGWDILSSFAFIMASKISSVSKPGTRNTQNIEKSLFLEKPNHCKSKKISFDQKRLVFRYH